VKYSNREAKASLLSCDETSAVYQYAPDNLGAPELAGRVRMDDLGAHATILERVWSGGQTTAEERIVEQMRKQVAEFCRLMHKFPNSIVASWQLSRD
jgi:hypothetical protein